jgi:hypothetical protein
LRTKVQKSPREKLVQVNDPMPKNLESDVHSSRKTHLLRKDEEKPELKLPLF